MGFDDFAERTGINSKTGCPCRTCSLPPDLLTEIEALRKRQPPISFNAIQKYLAEDHNIHLKEGTIGAHFRRCAK